MTDVTRIPLAAYDTGWDEAIEVSRQFGRRHDPEPAQPLVLLTFVQGEDGERADYWLAVPEVRALIAALEGGDLMAIIEHELVTNGDAEGAPTYGQRVRAARKDQGLSLTGFAATLGIHKSYLCDIELGRRTPGPNVAGPIWMHLGVRFESAREAALRLAVEQLLDAADRMRLGVTVPAEDWYTLRDYANMLLHGD